MVLVLYPTPRNATVGELSLERWLPEAKIAEYIVVYTIEINTWRTIITYHLLLTAETPPYTSWPRIATTFEADRGVTSSP